MTLLGGKILTVLAILATTVTTFGTAQAVAVTPQITGFDLIDSGSDDVIKSLDIISDTIVLAGVDGLNIQAITDPAVTKSVVFELDGIVVRTENNPPFLVGSDDNSGDVFGFDFPLGVHDLTATPYSDFNAGGTEGFSWTVELTVLAKPTVTTAQLVDTDTDVALATVERGQIFDLAVLPVNLAIQAYAETNPGTSLAFEYDSGYHVENNPPYALDGDHGPGDLIPTAFTTGWHNLKVTPYSEPDATGTSGTAYDARFKFVRSNIAVNVTTDGHDANPGDGVCEMSNGDGDCSFRAAIEEANDRPGKQTIGVPALDSWYGLTLGKVTVTDDVTIRGWKNPTISAGGLSTVLAVTGTETQASFVGLTLRNGNHNIERGGGLSIDQAAVQLYDSTVRNNTANYGGGIYLQRNAKLTMVRTRLLENSAGGDIDDFGGGGLTQRGGGISITNNSTAWIRQSTIQDNEAVRGGGISNFGKLFMRDTTVSGNRAASGGGGIENIHPFGEAEEWGVAQIAYSTIVDNTANIIHLDPADRRVGGGVRNTGHVFIGRSILAENSDGRDSGDALYSPDCYSVDADHFTSYRRNVVGVVSDNCLIEDVSRSGTPNDRVGSPASPRDPRISSFGRYFRPDSNSPALDYGRRNAISSWFKCQKTDNLGNKRPQDGDGNGSRRCDVGAIERAKAS